MQEAINNPTTTVRRPCSEVKYIEVPDLFIRFLDELGINIQLWDWVKLQQLEDEQFDRIYYLKQSRMGIPFKNKIPLSFNTLI